MRKISRRSVLAGAMVLPFAAWLEKYAHAAQNADLTRYDALSVQGKEMLRKYAAAVGKMREKPEADPQGWLFQWYTHAVRDDVTKGAEIIRVFGSAASPAKQLATDVWSTCRSHTAGQDMTDFLPWHRMYVGYFEHIIRDVSGDPSFTLPYWNYSVTGAAHGILPEEFRSPNDPVLKWLHRDDRLQRANDGRPIDEVAPTALALEALSEPRYRRLGARQGFCRQLDGGLHGNVHGLVGTVMNMGRVPWAARDPIFWLHHCNIDRLWASWNENGGKNPTDDWVNHQFVFVDGKGNRITAKNGDVTSTAQLHYSYDRLEPAPPDFQPAVAGPAAAIRLALVGVARDVPLSEAPVSVELKKPAGPADARFRSVTDASAALSASQRLFLVVGDLRTNVQPGVLYEISLDTPAQGGDVAKHRVGVVSFFDAEGRAAPADAGAPASSNRALSFDVTATAKALQTAGLLTEKTKVTITPVDKPESGAKPIVGEVSLVGE